MTNETYSAGDEPVHTSSQTDHTLTELQLYGWRPFQDEPDPRPLPEGNTAAAAVTDIFDALVATLGDTRLEPDLEELLWGTVNLFHRATSRVERDLDDNEQAQRRLQREQDGGEVSGRKRRQHRHAGQDLTGRQHGLDALADGEHLTGGAEADTVPEEVAHRPPRCFDSRLARTVGREPNAMRTGLMAGQIGDGCNERRPDLGGRMLVRSIVAPGMEAQRGGAG